MLVLFCDRALGGNLFIKSVVHGNYQLVCSVIADKTGCGNGYVAIAIVGSACNCRSLNSSPVCSSRLFDSATGGNCDFYLVVIVVVSNTTEVVCTCFGKFKSRYIRIVLYIFAGGLYHQCAGCVKYTNLTVVIAALYPPNLDGCSALGGEGDNILGCITNLCLAAKVDSLRCGIAVIKGLVRAINLGLLTVIDGEEALGSCLLSITVSLRALRHFCKVGCRIDGISGFYRSRLNGLGNLYLEVVVASCGRAYVILACLGNIDGGNVKGVLGRAICRCIDYRAVCIPDVDFSTVAARYPPDFKGCGTLGGKLNSILYTGALNLGLATHIDSLRSGIAVIKALVRAINLGLRTVMDGEEVIGSCLLSITVSLRALRHFCKVGCRIDGISGFYRSRLNGLGNLYLEVVVASCGRAYVILACLGNIDGGNVKGVLGRAICRCIDYRAVCIPDVDFSTVAARYPPDFKGCGTLGGKLNSILYTGALNLGLATHIDSLRSGIAVIKALVRAINLGLRTVMDGEEVIGSCLLGVTVSLRALRHCCKVGCCIKSMHNGRAISKVGDNQYSGDECNKQHRYNEFLKHSCFHVFLLGCFLF